MCSGCFRGAGGYDFPRDPNSPSDRDALFWIPPLQPDAVLLAAAPAPFAPAAMPINLSHLPGIDLRRAEDGFHAFWRPAGVGLQFWMRDMPIDAPITYATTLYFDAFFELRVHAALRLWRIMSGRTPGPSYRDMPAQLRRLNILRLRAVDARNAGASYRKIAEVLLNFHGSKEDFESDPRKNKVRRLAADGDALVHDGYRVFLHYPIKLKRG
jgi:Uncharacterized conserved protein (DUF2285)